MGTLTEYRAHPHHRSSCFNVTSWERDRHCLPWKLLFALPVILQGTIIAGFKNMDIAESNPYLMLIHRIIHLYDEISHCKSFPLLFCSKHVLMVQLVISLWCFHPCALIMLIHLVTFSIHPILPSYASFFVYPECLHFQFHTPIQFLLRREKMQHLFSQNWLISLNTMILSCIHFFLKIKKFTHHR